MCIGKKNDFLKSVIKYMFLSLPESYIHEDFERLENIQQLCSLVRLLFITRL